MISKDALMMAAIETRTNGWDQLVLCVRHFPKTRQMILAMNLADVADTFGLTLTQARELVDFASWQEVA